jgi:type IV pilus assembly protein PilV
VSARSAAARYPRTGFPARRSAAGFFLIEALVAILILALGILGLVAMGGTAVSAQSDAQYRTEASNLADSIAAEIALGVDRKTNGGLVATLPAFAHQTTQTTYCQFSGTPTLNGPVSALANQAANGSSLPGLPGATAANQQILVNIGTFNRVEITLCWKTPNDNAWRRHTLVTYVN